MSDVPDRPLLSIEHLCVRFGDSEVVRDVSFQIAPGEKFEHRILLSPDGEVAIRFSDMNLNLSPAGRDDE